MSQRQGRILVVDDDTGVLLAAEMLLAEHVEQIHTENQPERIPELLNGDSYDVVFLDMNYTRGFTDGAEGLHWLDVVRKRDPDAVVILMTAFGEVEVAVLAMKRGATDFVIKPWGADRLVNLVRDAVALGRTRRIAASQAEPADDLGRLRDELKSATAVQQRLRPSEAPRTRTLTCAVACETPGGVGGDFYDFIQVGDDRLGIALADVSGSGIPAALLMAQLQGHLRSAAPRYRNDLGDLVADLNRQVTTSTEDRHYITLFYGLYDDASRRLDYVNAGHLPPMIFRCASGFRSDPDEWLRAGGTVVGGFPDSRYHQASIQLEPGDLLVLYTDGVTEARNHRDQSEFGATRLAELVEREAQRGADAIVGQVLARLHEFSGSDRAADDRTLMVIEVR